MKIERVLKYVSNIHKTTKEQKRALPTRSGRLTGTIGGSIGWISDIR